jgi:chemotaxis protein CheD
LKSFIPPKVRSTVAQLGKKSKLPANWYPALTMVEYSRQKSEFCQIPIAPDNTGYGMRKHLHHFLLPGTIFASKDECLVTTILGSCIALCLWDSKKGIGGINHFMLPTWSGEGEANPKYGNIAIERLLKMMVRLGARKDQLVAKIFGGSSLITDSLGAYSIGDRNLQLAEQMMREHGIPVVAVESGGNSGRRLIFNTHTGVVLMKKSGKQAAP